MKVALYKNLSDACEYVDVNAGYKVKTLFKDLDFTKNYVIVNGQIKNEEYVLQETDLVVIRSIPMGATGLLVTEIILVSLATAGAIAGAIYMGIQAQKMKEELAKLQDGSSSTTADSVVNNPCIAGASNSVATNKTQPYVIGKHYFTPYVMNKGNGSATSFKGYHTIEGNKGYTQFFNTVLECGFNNQYVESISADDLVIKQFNEVKAKTGVFDINHNTIFGTDRSYGEIIQDGSAFTKEVFQKKIIEETKGEELKKIYDDDYSPLYYTLEKNSRGANICIYFPNGLRAYNKKGSRVPRSVKLVPQYSYDYAQLVAEGNEKPDENATWLDAEFTKVVDTTESVIDLKASYEGYLEWDGFASEYAPGYANDKQKKNFIREKINSMSYVPAGSDEDIRTRGTDFEIVSYTAPKGHYGEWTCVLRYYKNVITDTDTTGNTFTDDTTTQPYYNVHFDFDYDSVKDLEYPVTLKLSDDSEDAAATDAISQTMDTVQVAWVQSALYDVDLSATAGEFKDELIIDERERALSVLIGLHLEATLNNQDKLGKINILTNGMARTWDGTKWSVEKTPTSNPAAWALEILTSPTHIPSQCDLEIVDGVVTSDEIDLDSFGAWYEYCENPSESDDDFKLEVNMVLTDGVTKQSIIEDICKIGNAVTYNNIYGKIAVAIDTYKENAVALLNPQDIVSFEYNKSFARRVDGIKITYTDAAEGYTENTYLVMRDGVTRDANSVITSQTVKGITANSQIIKYARREMAIDELRPKTITATVGQEGVFYTPFSKVLVQHPSLKIGLGKGAEIKRIIMDADETHITGLEFYEPIEYDSTIANGFGLVVQCIGSNYVKELAFAYTAETNGRVTVVDLVKPVAILEQVVPQVHDICSYGYLNDAGQFDAITSEYLITGIEPNGDTVKLTLLDYNEAIYDCGTIPAYVPNITQPKTALTPTPTDVEKIRDEIYTQKEDTIDYVLDEVETFASGVNVYADVTLGAFYVDDAGYTIQKQKITTTVHAIQAGTEELDFVFGTLPTVEGFTITRDYHTVTIEVEEGVKITKSAITLPVIYRQILQNYAYTDETGLEYADENNTPYGDFELSGKSKQYDFQFEIVGVKAGDRKEPVTTIEDLESRTFIVGDFFTWSGETTESTLAEKGTFDKGTTYIYCGADTERAWQFKVDTNQSHMMTSLSDVLAVLDEEIQANNVKTVTLLNRLVANNIFVKTLVAQSAFIESLGTNQITINTDGFIQSEDYKNSNGLTGFKLKANGEAEFNNTATFRGNINNTVIKADAPTEMQSFSYVGAYYNCPCYNSTEEFYYDNVMGVFTQVGFIKYLDSDKQVITTKERLWASSMTSEGIPVCSDQNQRWDTEGNIYYPATSECNYSGYLYDVSTLYSKLYFYNLPDEDNADTNQVYANDDGILRIKQ